MQLLAELLRLAVMFFDFGNRARQLFPMPRNVLVRHHQVGHDQDVADHEGVLVEEIRQRQNLADHQRRAGQRFADGSLATLDALGQFDFPFTGEQRHRAHLAQIHAHGVVGLVAEILNELGLDLRPLRLLLESGLALPEFRRPRCQLGEQLLEFASAGILSVSTR